jgi:DNA-binding IclR family transcriptional regulator
MVERGLERVVLMAIEASHELRVVPALNSVVPIYSGASGKVFMAFMPEAERDRIIEVTGLKPVNERGLTDRKSFLKALEQVRKDGYAVTVGDVTLGAVAVAAPIFGRSDVLQGVVSVRGPEARMTSERVKLLAPLVVETADAISREVIGAMTPDDSR